MTNSAPNPSATHSIATVAGSAHLAELLRALPELTRAHIAAAAKFEACMQLLALGITTAPAYVPATSLDPEAFPASNPILLADQSARAAVQRRLARALDAKLEDIAPSRPARQSKPFARVVPTRAERQRRAEEKHQQELAECRARSAERHREYRRQAAERRRMRTRAQR